MAHFIETPPLEWKRTGLESYNAEHETDLYRVEWRARWWVAETRPDSTLFVTTWNDLGSYRDPKNALDACARHAERI